MSAGYRYSLQRDSNPMFYNNIPNSNRNRRKVANPPSSPTVDSFYTFCFFAQNKYHLEKVQEKLLSCLIFAHFVPGTMYYIGM
jgi:hypothetical protein